MADLFPPNGLDWADGLSGKPGTPTPNGNPAIRGGNGDGTFFEEEPESPEIERGEQCTIRHSFRCDYATGTVYLSAIGRGSVFTDSVGIVSRVLTCTLTRMKGNLARLVIVSESISFDTPPDEYEVDVADFNTAIEKHPHFKDLFNYNTDLTTGLIIDTAFPTGADLIERIKQAANAASIEQKTEWATKWTWPDQVDDPDIQDLGDELFALYRKGIETFILSGVRVAWSQYFYLPQPLDLGGYVQDPVTQGGLPPYFWSTDQQPTGNNTFTIISATTNPAIYGSGLSWIREADKTNYSRTWFKVSRTWVGGPLGHWESPVPYPPAIV